MLVSIDTCELRAGFRPNFKIGVFASTKILVNIRSSHPGPRRSSQDSKQRCQALSWEKRKLVKGGTTHRGATRSARSSRAGASMRVLDSCDCRRRSGGKESWQRRDFASLILRRNGLDRAKSWRTSLAAGKGVLLNCPDSSRLQLRGNCLHRFGTLVPKPRDRRPGNSTGIDAVPRQLAAKSPKRNGQGQRDQPKGGRSVRPQHRAVLAVYSNFSHCC